MKTPFLIKFCLIASIATTLFVACSTHNSDERFLFITSLFTGVEQSENLSRAHHIFPTSTLTASDDPYVFDLTDQIELPAEFMFRDKVVNVEEFIRRTDTAALLILKDGILHYENYWLTGGKDVQWMSMSVAKSYISALVGIAIDQGHIGNIFEPVTQYVSQLKDSAYDGVSIKDVLQMSSGARWSEDYSDADSDVMRSARILAVGGSLDQFSASLTNEFQPGTFNRYNSTDTQVLGMLLREATGVSVTQYMQEVLWNPIGAESNAYWLLDSEDMELVYGGLNATARDYAKLGEVFRLKGRFNGQQIVPSKWVEASITPDAPHLLPGKNSLSDFPLGYGYQWWIPDESGDFMAIGVYNQFIYISPKTNLVIVKLSANNAYGISEEISANSEFEAISFFKTIAGLSIGSSDTAEVE
jgi:CubicO group peptidase (beta-lactamase class C family)